MSFYACAKCFIIFLKGVTDFDRKPSYDENADPGEGLMNMLKKIYSEGDDEMKRTINKAWTESQEKKLKGEVMDF